VKIRSNAAPSDDAATSNAEGRSEQGDDGDYHRSELPSVPHTIAPPPVDQARIEERNRNERKATAHH
jgi:hypothetical protein